MTGVQTCALPICSQPAFTSYLSAGWLDLVSSALHDVDGLLAGASAYDLFEIHQIKEKFGRRRIYWSLEREGELALTVHPEGDSDRILTRVNNLPCLLLRQGRQR